MRNAIVLCCLLVFSISIVLLIIASVKKIFGRKSKKIWNLGLGCLIMSICLFLVFMGIDSPSSSTVLGAFILILTGVIFLFITGVNKVLLHKQTNHLRKAVVLLSIGYVFFLIGAGGNLSSILYLTSISSFFAAFLLFVISLGMLLAKKKRKILWLAIPICLGLGILSDTVSEKIWEANISKTISENEMYETDIEASMDFVVEDGDVPLEVVTSTGFDYDLRNRSVYDERDMRLLLEHDYATAEQCIDRVKKNKKISPQFRDYFCDFIKRVEKKYPGLNFAILYNNLDTLEVEELDQSDYVFKSLSIDSLGCYMLDENKIYIPKGTQYIEGEFGFQVLLHEFCHAMRTSWYESNDKKCKLQFCSDIDNKLLEECLNSEFSCSLLNYYEWDIAYQVPSNYLRIMLECMDNYSIEEYISHSDLYFLSKLDEYTGKTNYAQVIWKLITLQRSDWENDKIDYSKEEYYPIYDYLCEIYYGKYLNADMTEEEILQVVDELVYKAFYDAPEDYNIDKEYFYDYVGKMFESE